MSDDLSACVSPEFFRTFSIPANSVIHSEFGPGPLHNCWPNPCVREYLAHDPPLAGVNLAYEYSLRDLAGFHKPFARRGIIYTEFTGTPAEAAACCAAMLEVSKEYAERVWGR
jgi:hypothetical protein